MSQSTLASPGLFSPHTFEMLRDLWQQMAGVLGAQTQHLTELDLTTNPLQFSYIQSPDFHALLIGRPVNLANLDRVGVQISFVGAEIREFLQEIEPYLNPGVEVIYPHKENSSSIQNRFFEKMLDIFSPDRLNSREIQLQEQIQEERLLDDITKQIHQTLDLKLILQATVDRVQTLLQADRLLIYQFKFKPSKGKLESKFDRLESGRVMYEALKKPEIPSVLNFSEPDDCFNSQEEWQNYQQNQVKAIADVEFEYRDSSCLIELMKRYQIRAKVVVPLSIDGNLWGLLIAHQCHAPRHWTTREVHFLERIAEHLAFAIYQAELYELSKKQTQGLEILVAERTQELRDATIVAQTANQSKTEFLALLSHELRTPLTSILGLSSTLLRLPSLNLSERQQTYLQTIYNSGEHLSGLVDDILDFYKLEVGKAVLKVSEFSLPKLLKQTIEIVSPKAEDNSIDLQLQILDDGEDITDIGGRDLRFRGDTKRIRQVLINLLTNAFKFTPQGGTTILRVWMEDDMAVFEVEDSGIGIAPEQIPRLFTKFHQIDSTYGRDYAGMGLGLAITQQLVELHGGTIEVESTLSSGSTFTVRLASQPLKTQAHPLEQKIRDFAFVDIDRTSPRQRIMLLQNNERLADFISDILTADRYQVTWLMSTDVAGRQILLLQPDLLMINLDIGAEMVVRLVKNIRNHQPTNHYSPKIIIISAEGILIPSQIETDIDTHIREPIVPENLLKNVRKWCNN
jgi:two-component system, sensor histidine kinase and response regulator